MSRVTWWWVGAVITVVAVVVLGTAAFTTWRVLHPSPHTISFEGDWDDAFSASYSWGLDGAVSTDRAPCSSRCSVRKAVEMPARSATRTATITVSVGRDAITDRKVWCRILQDGAEVAALTGSDSVTCTALVGGGAPREVRS